MKISVIVPIYQVENYLRQCLDSILTQTYRELELILVDDGSPDACPQICDEYAAKDTRVKVIHKKNGGLSDARNAGIAAATGDYVMFVDGDDWLSLNTLERCVSELSKEPDADCLIFSYVREYPQQSLPAHVFEGSFTVAGEEAEERVYRRLFGLVGDELKHPERLESMGTCWGKLYRPELARHGRFFDTAEVGSSEDTLFNMYALCGCQKVVYVDEPLYHYRKTRQSITNAYRPRLIEQWGRLFDCMKAVIEEKQLGPAYREALDGRIALSVFGIGSNEMTADRDFFHRRKKVKDYISTSRYRAAISEIGIFNMPLPWQAMLFFARYKLSFLLCLELALIQRVRRSL